MTTELQRVNVEKKGRHYVLPSGRLVPSVTNVLGILDKPALKYWAGQVEREYVIDIATSIYGKSTQFAGSSRKPFETELRETLGAKYAHQMRLKTAGDIGTSLHNAIQQSLKGEENDTLDGPALLAFMAWEDWAKSVALEPLHVETMVGSETMGAGGTLDCAGYANVPGLGAKPQVVFDWKSSKRSKSAPNGIYFEAKVQVAVYRAIAIEMEMISEDAWGAVVRLPKSENDPVLTEKEPFDVAWLDPEECDRLAKGFLSILDTWTFVKVGA